MTKEQIFEDILNDKRDALICLTCSKTQTHRAVYCQQCGTQYKKHDPLTLMQRIKSASMVATRWKKILVEYRPSYVAAIYWRKYRDVATKEEFILYIEEKLKEKG